ncbi:MAG: hypothetical protein GY696_28320 [Gammaproteobacteria bacterium]|nr:hypothetical protein [Gammaproteobacteria bacterium]
MMMILYEKDGLQEEEEYRRLNHAWIRLEGVLTGSPGGPTPRESRRLGAILSKDGLVTTNRKILTVQVFSEQ